jgi:hypothetical protein
VFIMSDIKPGSQIKITVTKQPTNAAGVKTVVRLLSRDPHVKQENARLKVARQNHFRQSRRGGRFWDINVVKQHPVKAAQGESGTITATLDVLADLKSVEQFLEIKPA